MVWHQPKNLPVLCIYIYKKLVAIFAGDTQMNNKGSPGRAEWRSKFCAAAIYHWLLWYEFTCRWLFSDISSINHSKMLKCTKHVKYEIVFGLSFHVGFQPYDVYFFMCAILWCYKQHGSTSSKQHVPIFIFVAITVVADINDNHTDILILAHFFPSDIDQF